MKDNVTDLREFGEHFQGKTESRSYAMNSTANTKQTDHTDCDPVPDTTKWFTGEEMYWRTVASMAWVAMILPFIALVYIWCVSLDIWHPILWISGTLDRTFALQFVLDTLVIQLATVSVGYSCFSTAKVIPSHHSNKFGRIKFLINPKQSIWICYFGCLGTFLASMLLKIRGNQPLFDLNENSESILNERSYFLINLGTVLGLRQGILYFLDDRYCVQFPVIQETLVFRIKRSLAKIFNGTGKETIKTLQIFYITYFLFGKRPRNIFMVLLNLHPNELDTPLTSILGLLDIKLFFEAFMMALTLKLIFSVSAILFSIFISQTFSFPVEVVYADEIHRTLKDAIQSPNEILKALAVHDILRISQQSSKRRRQLFSLSQPGGKAVTWAAVSGVYLKHLQLTASKLADSQKKEMRVPIAPKQVNATPSTVQEPTSELYTPDSPITRARSQQQSPLGPAIRSRVTPNPALSRMVLASSYSSLGKMNTGSHGVEEMVSTKNKGALQTRARATIEKWKQLPLVEFFLKEDPDAHFHRISDEMQLTLWMIDGLSGIVAASMVEDQFGIVQRETENLLKLRGKNSRHPHRSTDVQAHNNKTKNLLSLKLATETAMYKLTTTFGNHLSFLKLTPAFKRRLGNFLEFRE